MSLVAWGVRRLGERVAGWPLATVIRRGRRLGRLAYRLDRRHRQVALDNLARAFPEREPRWRREIARASFEQVGRTALETLWSRSLERDRLDRVVDSAQSDRIFDALDEERGVVLASGHFGNWELTGIVLGMLGVPLVSIARPLDDPGLDRLLVELRTRTGSRVLPKHRALRGALRTLRAGDAVAILVDQNTQRHEAEFVPFFGHPAATSPVLGHLHLRTGAPVLPVFTVPRPQGYDLVVEEPIECPTRDREAAVREITAAVTRRIESRVRSHPRAWLWMHDRWRERP